MERVTAIEDTSAQFTISGVKAEDFTVNAMDIVILYDSCAPGQSVTVRYSALQSALSDKFGTPISAMTAYLILDKAVGIVQSLKKTAFASDNSKSSESTPALSPPTS